MGTETEGIIPSPLAAVKAACPFRQDGRCALASGGLPTS